MNVSVSFSAKVIRSQPFWMGSAFAISAVGLLASDWLNERDIEPGRVFLKAMAFAFVWGGASAPVSAYFVRKSEGIPVRSAQTKHMALFSLIWSVGFGCLGLLLLGCAGLATSCVSVSNLQNSLVAASVIGVLLSLMALSS